MDDNRQRLAGRVAIVTGAGRGIGREEALLLAQQGAAVVVNDIGSGPDGKQTAAGVVEEIRAAGGRAEASYDSVTDGASAAAIVGTALDTFGGLDIVVNNAGVVTAGLVETFADTDFDRVVNTHLKGTFLLIKHAVPLFKGQRSGAIVNTASESGLGHATNSPYSAAKEGILGLTRSVAREVGGFGIRCNAIRPRAGGTPGAQGFRAESEPWHEATEALGRYRLGERGHIASRTGPKDIAPLVVWLCTDAAAHVNGYTFAVEGNLVGVWSEPSLSRSMVREEGWDLASLDETAPESLTFDLENRFHAEFD